MNEMIPPRPLAGRRVLVVEDEFAIADLMAEMLQERGVQVMGPAATVLAACELIARGPALDAALVDVNLRGGTSFPIADALLARRVPFAFMTGYDDDAIPARYACVRRYQKPANPLRALAGLLWGEEATGGVSRL